MGQHVGRATAIAHHGELLQGEFEAGAGTRVRGLVSLPYSDLQATATFRNLPCRALVVSPNQKTKAKSAAELTLDWLGEPRRGLLEVMSQIPERLGLGSSTADVVASIRAVAASFGRQHELTPEREATIAVQAEGASDSVMFGRKVVIFGQRLGVIVDTFDGALPPLQIIGFDGAQGRAGIDTIDLPMPTYTGRELAVFEQLRRRLHNAVATGSTATVARVCWASARINQRYLEKPLFAAAERIVRSVGAAGIQVAHSGTVIGLLFDRADPRLEDRINSAVLQLDLIGVETTWQFCVG